MTLFGRGEGSGDSARVSISAPGEDVNELYEMAPRMNYNTGQDKRKTR